MCLAGKICKAFFIFISEVIPFGGQYAMNLSVHIEGLTNVKEEIR